MGKQNRCRLDDIRQIGPNSERDISGVCSGCGTTLLARLDSKGIPTREQLEDALQALFSRHVSEEHSDRAVTKLDGNARPN
jgi:hypothetical protein